MLHYIKKHDLQFGNILNLETYTVNNSEISLFIWKLQFQTGELFLKIPFRVRTKLNMMIQVASEVSKSSAMFPSHISQSNHQQSSKSCLQLRIVKGFSN